MAIEILKSDEIKGWSASRLSEVEVETRRQLAQIRMDIYQSAQGQSGNIVKLKKNLARLLTVKTEQRKSAAPSAKAPKAAAAPKAKKAKPAAKAKKATKAKGRG